MTSSSSLYGQDRLAAAPFLKDISDMRADDSRASRSTNDSVPNGLLLMGLGGSQATGTMWGVDQVIAADGKYRLEWCLAGRNGRLGQGDG
jgi:hypothetical protein